MRTVILLVCIVTMGAMVYAPLKELLQSNTNSQYYSHIILIPLIAAYLLFQKRKYLYLLEHSYSIKAGTLFTVAGIGLYLWGIFGDLSLNINDYASFVTFSGVMFFVGAFMLIYGFQTFKTVSFPLLILLFMVPIPTIIMEQIIYILQVGSTEFTNLLFLISGVPFVREGFVFHLPGMSVEVAPQCSGIRSSLALFITALLAGHLFLRTWWRKVILVFCIFPIAMFKNGIRIVTLTLLGTYVDPRILQSSLHREGGIPFFIVALMLMAPVLYFLRKTEKGSGDRG